jgi:hypothetical protein
VKPAASRRVDGAGLCPGISSGIVSPAGVHIAAAEPVSAPDYHFVARPHRRVNLASRRRIGGAGGRPTIRAGIVSPASVEEIGRASTKISTSPDNHLTASPHCRVTLSCRGRVNPSARGYPTIHAGTVSSAGVQTNEEGTFSTPDYHFIAGPDRRVLESAIGRVGGAGGRPTIRAGIVSPAGVQNGAVVKSAQMIISLPVQTAL